jgi:glycosyltransferase involved in cell wall biosynthesis
MNSQSRPCGPLKVAVMSSASGGGAGIAARRVADALNLSDEISADFLDMVALGGRMPDDSAPPGNMNNRRITDTHFTVEFPGYVRGWLIDLLRQYDVLNIHWASYLLGLAEIDELSRLGMPILFTCHDYFYFTGGCHYPATCTNLAKGCIACPQVNQDYCPSTIIAQNQRIKKHILSRPNVHLAAPSAFLVNEAVEAGMIAADRTHVLRNPYCPVSGLAGKRDGPPRIVLMADSMAERRKAMPLAIESLGMAYRNMKHHGNDQEPFFVDLIGNADETFLDSAAKAGFPANVHGKISDHLQIARLLSECDVLLTCSFEDNWPNVLVEAGAYGVAPVVGPGHGCEEFVRQFGVGEIACDYTARFFSVALITAIARRNEQNVNEFQKNVVSEHAPERVCSDYMKAITKIMNASPIYCPSESFRVLNDRCTQSSVNL